MFDEWSGNWQRGSSFNATFGVSGFSAPVLASIHNRIADDVNLRTRWENMMMAGSPRRLITSATWRLFWCAQDQFARGYVGCAGLQRRVELLPIAAGAGGAAILIVIALVAVRLGRARKRV